MTNLILTRKAGQGVRLLVSGNPAYLSVLDVCGGYCWLKLETSTALVRQRVRFRDFMQIAEGVSVCVVDLAKGHAKLNFTAPRDVHILRTELIKEEI